MLRTHADEHGAVRIRHIAVLPHPGRWPGILARQAGMARASRQLGLDIRFTLLCREDPREPDLEAVRLSALYRTSRCRAILGSGVLDDCDAAVLRYPTTAIDLAAGMLAGRHGVRLVSEHHTDEVAEFRTMGPTGRLRAFLEERTKPRYLVRMAGIIAVTDELRRLESRSAPLVPSLTIGNGISVDATPMHGPAIFDGSTLRLVWTCSEFSPWQGLDRLTRALASISTGPRIELHLAGTVSSEQSRLILRSNTTDRLNIQQHGQLLGPELDALLRRAHATVGTLALHRKGMREACALKVRESVARGLPTLLANDDPDLPRELPGIIRLPSGEVDIDGRRLIDEIVAAATDPQTPYALRAHAETHLDWGPKLRRMIGFLDKTVGQCA